MKRVREKVLKGSRFTLVTESCTCVFMYVSIKQGQASELLLLFQEDVWAKRAREKLRVEADKSPVKMVDQTVLSNEALAEVGCPTCDS